MKDTDAGLVVIFGGRSEIGIELAARLAPDASAIEYLPPWARATRHQLRSRSSSTGGSIA